MTKQRAIEVLEQEKQNALNVGNWEKFEAIQMAIEALDTLENIKEALIECGRVTLIKKPEDIGGWAESKQCKEVNSVFDWEEILDGHDN